MLIRFGSWKSSWVIGNNYWPPFLSLIEDGPLPREVINKLVEYRLVFVSPCHWMVKGELILILAVLSSLWFCFWLDSSFFCWLLHILCVCIVYPFPELMTAHVHWLLQPEKLAFLTLFEHKQNLVPQKFLDLWVAICNNAFKLHTMCLQMFNTSF